MTRQSSEEGQKSRKQKSRGTSRFSDLTAKRVAPRGGERMPLGLLKQFMAAVPTRYREDLAHALYCLECQPGRSRAGRQRRSAAVDFEGVFHALVTSAVEASILPKRSEARRSIKDTEAWRRRAGALVREGKHLTRFLDPTLAAAVNALGDALNPPTRWEEKTLRNGRVIRIGRKNTTGLRSPWRPDNAGRGNPKSKLIQSLHAQLKDYGVPAPERKKLLEIFGILKSRG